jgi:hypothetical protein
VRATSHWRRFLAEQRRAAPRGTDGSNPSSSSGESANFWVPERRSRCIGLLTSAELGAVRPHPVQDDGEAAGQGDDRRSPHETTRPRKTPRGSAPRQSGDCDPPAPVIPCQGPRRHGGPTPGPWGLSRGPHSACPGRAPGGRPPSTAMPRRSRRRRRCARRSTRVQDPDPVHFVLGQSRRAGDP